MPTKELLVDIGNYLEGNYDMGGGLKKLGEGADYLNQRASGGDSKHYENMGAAGDKTAGDNFEMLKRGPGDKNAFNETMRMGLRWVDEVGNFIANDPRGHNQKLAKEREAKAQAEAMANRTTGAFAQDDKKKKKKKGLLAMNTPSAKASRFRSGKRRFRVKPGSGTGVNVGGASGSASVGTS